MAFKRPWSRQRGASEKGAECLRGHSSAASQPGSESPTGLPSCVTLGSTSPLRASVFSAVSEADRGPYNLTVVWGLKLVPTCKMSAAVAAEEPSVTARCHGHHHGLLQALTECWNRKGWQRAPGLGVALDPPGSAYRGLWVPAFYRKKVGSFIRLSWGPRL